MYDDVMSHSVILFVDAFPGKRVVLQKRNSLKQKRLPQCI